MPSTWFQAWRDAAWAAFRPLISSDVSCAGATGRYVHEPAGQVFEFGAPTTPAGGNASTQGLAGGATLIKWATDTGGRSGKGRTFLPGLTNGVIGPGGRTYTAAHATATATAITNYLGSSAFTAEIRPAVLSFTKGAAYPITNGAISPIIGLQRRRMR
jgi:hypothetical protein